MFLSQSLVRQLTRSVLAGKCPRYDPVGRQEGDGHKHLDQEVANCEGNVQSSDSCFAAEIPRNGTGNASEPSSMPKKASMKAKLAAKAMPKNRIVSIMEPISDDAIGAFHQV